jgi:hypothetical protein
MPKQTQWTMARVEQLLELNEAGLPAAKIAEELNKTAQTRLANGVNLHQKHFKPSKNAVIGKLHRLGLNLGQARAKPAHSPTTKRKRSVEKRLATSVGALQGWKQNGYQPSEYVAPPLAEHISFDRMWWASLSHREQLKILTMGTVETVRGYAAASKRRFIDSNSLG